MRTARFTNGNGDSIDFDNTRYNISSLENLGGAATLVSKTRSPYQNGSSYVSSVLSDREIVLTGVIVGAYRPATIAPFVYELERVLSSVHGMGTLEITNDNGSFVCSAIPISSPAIRNKHASNPFQEFMVTFLMNDPFFYDAVPISVDLTITGMELEMIADGIDMVAAGVELDVLSSINNQTLNIVNEGHVPTPVHIRMYGPATNPSIEILETGETISFTLAIAAGDYLDIETAYGAEGVDWYDLSVTTHKNGMPYLNEGSVFFEVPIGGCSMTFLESSGSGGSHALITYSERYVGI
jgi:hypothetical protein